MFFKQKTVFTGKTSVPVPILDVIWSEIEIDSLLNLSSCINLNLKLDEIKQTITTLFSNSLHTPLSEIERKRLNVFRKVFWGLESGEKFREQIHSESTDWTKELLQDFLTFVNFAEFLKIPKTRLKSLSAFDKRQLNEVQQKYLEGLYNLRIYFNNLEDLDIETKEYFLYKFSECWDFVTQGNGTNNLLAMEELSLRDFNLSNRNFHPRFNLENYNFKGVNWPGIDLRGLNLRGVSFAGANLEGAIFMGCDLSGSDFSGANLTRANFSHANLNGTNFTQARFHSVKIDYTKLDQLDTTEVSLGSLDSQKLKPLCESDIDNYIKSVEENYNTPGTISNYFYYIFSIIAIKELIKTINESPTLDSKQKLRLLTYVKENAFSKIRSSNCNDLLNEAIDSIENILDNKQPSRYLCP